MPWGEPNTPSTAPATPDRRSGGLLPSLTGLRFAAALMVFGVHGFSFIPLAQPRDQAAAQLLLDAGDLGVSFFFVLSGFVLTWSARPGTPVWRFWRNRIARIYPAHLVALVYVLGCLWVSDRFAKVTTQTMVTGLLLIQSWYPKDYIYLGVNAVTWSLSCEMAFYLCFPLLHAGLRRLGPAALYGCAAALCAAVWLMPVVADLAVPADHRRWFVYIFPMTRMLEFALGIVLALLVRSGAWSGPRLPLATGIFVVNYLLVTWLPAPARDTAAIIVAIMLLIPAAATADLRGAPSLWRHPFLVRLGEISYSFYLVHLATIVTVVTLIDRGGRWPLPHAVGLGICLLVLAYGIAALLFTFVEMPALRLLTGRSPLAARIRLLLADRLRALLAGRIGSIIVRLGSPMAARIRPLLAGRVGSLLADRLRALPSGRLRELPPAASQPRSRETAQDAGQRGGEHAGQRGGEHAGQRGGEHAGQRAAGADTGPVQLPAPRPAPQSHPGASQPEEAWSEPLARGRV